MPRKHHSVYQFTLFFSLSQFVSKMQQFFWLLISMWYWNEAFVNLLHLFFLWFSKHGMWHVDAVYMVRYPFTTQWTVVVACKLFYFTNGWICLRLPFFWKFARRLLLHWIFNREYKYDESRSRDYKSTHHHSPSKWAIISLRNQ